MIDPVSGREASRAKAPLSKKVFGDAKGRFAAHRHDKIRLRHRPTPTVRRLNHPSF